MKPLIFIGKMEKNRYKILFLFLVSFGVFHFQNIHSQGINTDSIDNQIKFIRKELAFINYCEGKHRYREALTLLNRLKTAPGLQGALLDSVNFLLGWDYYSVKELDSSSFYLFRVSNQSEQYLKAECFGAYNTIFVGERQKAREYFSSLKIPERLNDSLGPLIREVISFELAGISLLDRDYKEFNRHAGDFSYSFYTLTSEEKNFLSYKKLLEEFKPRSGWIAGIMSAILPGSGKIYAGKTGEGVAAFLIVGSLGLLGWENYNKDGFLNWKTMIAGGIFTVYYAGNIIGSVKAAERYNHAYTQALDHRILFDLHIPLRNIFN